MAIVIMDLASPIPEEAAFLNDRIVVNNPTLNNILATISPIADLLCDRWEIRIVCDETDRILAIYNGGDWTVIL